MSQRHPVRLRPSALEEMTALQNDIGHGACKMLDWIVDLLAHSDAPSILLPVNGLYIEPEIPIGLSSNRFVPHHLPENLRKHSYNFSGIEQGILEYSISPEGYCSSTSSTPQHPPSAALILVVQTGFEHDTLVFPLFQQCAQSQASWQAPSFMLTVGSKASIKIMPSGEPEHSGIEVSKVHARSLKSGSHDLFVRESDLSHILRVLVQFQLIGVGGGNPQLHHWPPANGSDGKPLPQAHYYTMRYAGPSRFDWLPSCATRQ